jgi:hypothetical protein
MEKTDMKRVKDFTVGETAIDRGRRFIIERIVINPKTGEIAFVDTAGGWHDWYSLEQYLGVAEAADGD